MSAPTPSEKFRDDLAQFFDLIGSRTFWERGEKVTDAALRGLVFSFERAVRADLTTTRFAVLMEVAMHDFARRRAYWWAHLASRTEAKAS